MHGDQPPLHRNAVGLMRHPEHVKPRSVVLDLAGDYIRYHDGVIALGAMTELLGAFDVSDDNVRVLMSRLRREGFFQTQRQGRTTEYVLAPDILQLLDEGRERIFARHPDAWDGTWHMVIYQVPEIARASRERLRTGLSWLGFGALAPSTWMSARDRRVQVRELLGRESEARFDQVTARSEGAAQDRDLAARCWDLRQLAEDYRAWIDAWRDLDPDGMDDKQALVQRTRLVYSYRKFPFADPDLPSALTPGGWPGTEAHSLFLALYDALGAPAQRWFRKVIGED
ncbi:MAG: PaaX family transcriptional regulator [Actinomycetota bacterium]|nr:PaaX family transcriptional regulator [Actinomycetota bacterium]